MNVFFLDYRYFREDSWKCIVQVLKIKKVYSFAEPSYFLPLSFGEVPVVFKPNTEEARNNIAYDIAKMIKKPIYIDGDFLGYDDCDSFQHSRWSTPEENIKNTDDPNILVLGKVTHSTDGYNVTPYFNVINNCDTGCEIVGYSLNILKKQLETDKYKNRICFLLIDIINEHDYTTTGLRWNSFPRFYYFLLWELHIKFPHLYQIDIIDGKLEIKKLYEESYYTEKNKLKQSHQKEKMYVEECEAFDEAIESGKSWQDEVDEMNSQFWNECGDAINEM